MHFLALLLGESLEPPRDVHGDGYESVLVIIHVSGSRVQS